MNRTTQRAAIFIGLLVIIVVLIIALTLPPTAPAPGTAPTRPNLPTPQTRAFAGKPAVTPALDAARIFFFDPQDGDAVDSPVYVRVGAANFNVGDGRPRFHLIIDADCLAPGEAIPEDDHHLRFAIDQFQTTLDLPMGPHRLCIEASDANNVALSGDGMLQVIDFTVTGGPTTETPR